jgi:hypothetical protein
MRLRKFVISACAVGAVSLVTAASVYATGSTDTDDSFNLKGAAITGVLKTGTSMVFTGTIDSVINITVTCKSFKASGTTPTKGLVVDLAKSPTISSCTDSTGGTDTITTNTKNGKWVLTEVDATNDETAVEPTPLTCKGTACDKGTLTIPKAGATFASSLLSGCVITVAPTKAVTVSGTYNDVNTITVKNASIPVVGNSKCTASASTISGTIVLQLPKGQTKLYDVS